MPLQKIIRLFKGETQLDTGGDSEDMFFKTVFSLYNKPFFIKRIKVKLIWKDNSRINSDTSDPDEPFQKWFQGNTLYWCLYKDTVTLPQEFKFPSVDTDTEFWPYNTTANLLEYGIQSVHKGPDVPAILANDFQLSFPENWFPVPNFSAEGHSIIGSVELAAGTGGPIELISDGFSIEAGQASTPNPTILTAQDFQTVVPFNGGTTIDTYECCSDDLTIAIDPKQDQLIFVGAYERPGENINTGQDITATFEFIIQY